MQGIFNFVPMEEFIDQKSQFQQGFVQSRPLPNATATLVLGIVSIVFCGIGFITGTIAIVLHRSDKRLYDSDPMTYEQSYKNARAGYICGIVGVCVSVAVIIIYVCWMIFIFSMMAKIAPYQQY